MKEKILSLVLASALLVTSSVSANIVSTTDIGTALGSGDFETADRLIKQEVVADPSLTVTGTMTINENNVLKDFNWNVLGMQNEIMKDGDIFFNRFTNEFTDGFMAMADIMYDIPTARWGGGTSNYIGLFENMGPLEERKPSVYIAETPYGSFKAGQVATEGVSMGPVEFIKMIQMINPNASFMFCLPLDVNTPEQTLNFTRFLLDDKNESEWGALRASYGIEEPVNLLGYELGNEDYFTSEPDVVNSEYAKLSTEEQNSYNTSSEYIKLRDRAIDRYVNVCLAHLQAIHKEYPEVKFYPNVNGGIDRVSCEAWDVAVANRLCNQPGVDGVAYHAYYAAHGSTITNERRMDAIQSWFVRETGKKTKFVHTEHAKWSANESITRQSHYSALCEPFFINHMVMRDDIVCANYHNIVCGSTLRNPGTWAFFTRKGDKYYEAGINKVYKLYTENLGNKVIKSDVSLDNWDNEQISAIATKKEDGTVVLSLTNYYEDRNIDLDIDLNGEYKISKTSVFTAPNYSSIVYGDSTKDVYRVTTTYGGGKISNYTIPNKSLAILVLTPAGSGDDDTVYSYEEIVNEDFESYDVTTTPFTLVKNSGVNSINTFGKWNLKTYVNVLYSTNSSASITEDKELKMTPTSVGYNYAAFPVLEYGGDLSKLENHFKISFDYNKASTTSGGGIKFMVHNNGKNYYVLWLCGLFEDKYKWLFNKVENNQIVDTVYGETYTAYNDSKEKAPEEAKLTGITEGTISANSKDYDLTKYTGSLLATLKSGPIHYKGTVGIEYDNGKISWAIDGYEYDVVEYHSEGKYTDKTPFSVNAKSTTFSLGSNSSTPDTNRYITYDNIKIGSYVPKKEVVEEESNSENYPQIKKEENSTDEFVVNDEPNSVIYADRTIPYGENMLYCPTSSSVRKIVNTGDTTVKVYASTDNYSYKLIAEVEPSETFVNNLSSKKFSYIKLVGGTAKVYTDLNEDMVLTAIEDVCDLSAKVNGSTENITYTSSNRNIAYIEDNKLIPLRNGEVTITATNGTDSVSKTVKVSALTQFKDNFQSFTKGVEIQPSFPDSYQKVSIGNDWSFIRGYGGLMGAMPKIIFDKNGMNYYGTGGVRIFYHAVPYLRYDGDYSGLGEKYTIKLTYNRSSVMSGLGIKFGLHNDDSNYYMLELSSGGSGSGYVWSFYKVIEHGIENQVNGEEYTAYNADKTGPLQGKGTVEINVDGNNISWKIDGRRYSNRKYTGTGSFTDENPFNVSPRNTRVALVSYAYNNGYYTTISNFEIVGDGDKKIIESPLNNGDKYISISGGTNPIKIIKDDNDYQYEKEEAGDNFFKISPSDYKTANTKIMFIDLDTLKPLVSQSELK